MIQSKRYVISVALTRCRALHQEILRSDGYQRRPQAGLVGFWNSVVSATVTFIFPWELSHLGSAGTFPGYGLFALAALVFVLLFIPKTKGKTLEGLETNLMRDGKTSTTSADALSESDV